MSDPLVPTPAAAAAEIRRLGKNVKSYLGETIDIAAVLSDCTAAAQQHGWTVEEISTHPKPGLLALSRPSIPVSSGAKPLVVYLSTGIHGDEPAGPLAARQLLQENRWPAALRLFLCPCLNPAGFGLNRRENGEGADLNRQYLQPKAQETQAHIAWLSRQPAFDLCLCLHEDWEAHGFYLYELNPDGRTSLAPSILESVASVCPVDHSEIIEGRPAQGGIIRANVDPRTRPQWPESFYLLTHKTRLSYTLEAPSDFALPVRVAALVQAVRAALAGLLESRPESP
jgi:hypothetical protein